MSREIEVKALKDKLRRYEEALLQIEELVFHNQSIPLRIRESIQEQVVLRAGVHIAREKRAKKITVK